MTPPRERAPAGGVRPAAEDAAASEARGSIIATGRVGDASPGSDASAFLPIAEHGVIGDMHSVALVGTDGTIDWYCPDRFDAASVFGALLDPVRGGHYRIAPASPGAHAKQLYFPDTNVLITRFLSPEGVGEVQDFMPVDSFPQRLVRRVVAVRGSMSYRLELEPRFNYGRDEHQVEVDGHHARFTSPSSTMSLASPVAMHASAAGVGSDFTLDAGQSHTFVLQSGDDASALDDEQSEDLMRATIAYWRDWIGQSEYVGRWRERVHRSALTLKLLTYAPTGAIVAAPTTSLPEHLGGTRNWDYRYAWIRDFSFSLYALLRLGFTVEASELNGFSRMVALSVTPTNGTSPLRAIYGIDQDADTTEQTLDHLSGYQNSAPVRIGNAARDQLQLDIYGALFDSIYLFEQLALEGRGQLIDYESWRGLAALVDWLSDHWQAPDDGIWEVRNGRRRFTYSRLMCWVALDRAIRIAVRRALPANLDRWARERDAIYAWIMERGWNDDRQAFVQCEDTDVLDASLLLMPLVHFIAPTDPRWLSTLDAIGRELVADSLVYRYDPVLAPDGLDGREGTFSMCTFWYVECLARAGQLEDAQLIFEKMLTYSNHLGLYSEEIGEGGELLGNFPQALTHLAMISAAINVDQELSRGLRPQ
jgi:GH15 family glucan-1,4-alpha-glucosidase